MDFDINRFTWTLVAVLIGLLALLLYQVFSHAYDHWRQRGVPFVIPKFILGNLLPVMVGRKTLFEYYDEMYATDGFERYIGTYAWYRPVLIVKDVELIRNILTRDFEYFTDRGLNLYREQEPLTHHLGTLSYARWKPLRKKLSPVFSFAKLKAAFPIMKECCCELDRLCARYAEVDEPTEIKDLMCRLTIDVIGSYAFGIEANSLTNPQAEFRKISKRIFRPRWEIYVWLVIKDVAPSLAPLLGLRFFDKEVTDFFNKCVADVISYREKNGVTRDDFLDLLIAMKKEDIELAKENDKSNILGKSEILIHLLGNVTGFDHSAMLRILSASFDTSSSTMTFCLLELARNRDIREKVQKEIDQVLDEFNGDFVYESMQKLQYLETVILETLRMYPPLYLLSRTCTRDYTIPGTDSTIEKNTEVIMPVFSIHRDSRYFPNPQTFDPENFSAEKKNSRHPFCYLPFGEGPKICIGLKFGMMQIKLTMATLLRKYDVELSKKTKFPIKFVGASLTTNSARGIYLKFSKRKK